MRPTVFRQGTVCGRRNKEGGGINTGAKSKTISYLLESPSDLLHSDEQEHVQDAHKLGEYETEDVEEETLAVVEDKQRRLQ